MGKGGKGNNMIEVGIGEWDRGSIATNYEIGICQVGGNLEHRQRKVKTAQKTRIAYDISEYGKQNAIAASKIKHFFTSLDS